MTLFGHEHAWSQWRAAMNGARMHHAWLLAGPSGVGKAKFAMAASRELVAGASSAYSPEMHPDITLLSHLPASAEDERKREEGKPYQVKRSISVDQIRQMQQRLHTRPTLGDWRAIIIDPADDLEKGAANALLKSLEEPPQGTVFLLVTHRPGRLLPTIRSRCRILRFGRLSDTQVDEVLRREAPECSNAERAAAVSAAGGAPGVALRFIALELAAIHQILQRITETGDPDFSLRGQLADAIGVRPERARQQAVVELAQALVASRVRQVKRSEISRLLEVHEAVARLAVEVPTANFDPGLLMLETGGLLARLAETRGAAHG